MFSRSISASGYVLKVGTEFYWPCKVKDLAWPLIRGMVRGPIGRSIGVLKLGTCVLKVVLIPTTIQSHHGYQ
jgi:hypothetical protein